MVDGIRYQNYGFEVITQQDQGIVWTDLLSQAYTKLYEANNEVGKSLPQEPWSYGNWFPAWLLFGRANRYLILQGNRLTSILKTDLLSHCYTKGFDHTRSLARERLAGQNGRNAISGYIKWDTLIQHNVPHRVILTR
jgi:hypothetical protein